MQARLRRKVRNPELARYFWKENETGFAQNYGDILGVLKTLERGEELIHVPTRKATISARIDEHIERVPTAHDEMQWGD